MEFKNSTLETIHQFHDALSDFLESMDEDDCAGDCSNCPLNEDDDLTTIHENEDITIEFTADEDGRVPFEVALTAMRDGLRVREKNWDG